MNGWGISTSIDLFGCNPELIRDEEAIADYLSELVDLIDMTPYGEPLIIRFGKDDKEGYSAVQLIETSCITCHFDETHNNAYIDIFSCKDYDPDVAYEFTAEYFDSDYGVFDYINRG